MSWYIIKFWNFGRHQFLGIGGNLQFETIRRGFGARFPSPNVERVLRLPSNLLARDNIAARVGAGTLRDPDLPIDLLRPESEVIAFDAVDHAASEVFRVVDLGHQLFIRIRHQQIGGWDGPVVFVPQYVD